MIAEQCAVSQLEVLVAHADSFLRSPMSLNCAVHEMAARQYDATVQRHCESRLVVPDHQGPESNAEGIELQVDDSPVTVRS